MKNWQDLAINSYKQLIWFTLLDLYNRGFSINSIFLHCFNGKTKPFR